MVDGERIEEAVSLPSLVMSVTVCGYVAAVGEEMVGGEVAAAVPKMEPLSTRFLPTCQLQMVVNKIIRMLYI